MEILCSSIPGCLVGPDVNKCPGSATKLSDCDDGCPTGAALAVGDTLRGTPAGTIKVDGTAAGMVYPRMSTVPVVAGKFALRDSVCDTRARLSNIGPCARTNIG